MNYEIIHDTDNRKFYTVVDKYECYLEYMKKGPTIMDIYDVFVPVVLRNEDIATKLTEEAMKYAQRTNLQVLPSCEFVENYLDNHHEYDKMRVKDFEKKL